MTALTVTVAPVARIEHSASLTDLGGIVVKGRAKRKGKGSVKQFHTILRPSRLIRRQDGKITIQSHALPSYTVTLTEVEVLAAWDKDDKTLDLTLVL